MNFKVRCIDTAGQTTNYTKGKIYEIKNGVFRWDDGNRCCVEFKNVESLNSCLSAKFELVSNPVVVITRNNRETIATLKDGKTILKVAKAACNPTDTFNAEFGRALALARLNNDQKMVDFLIGSLDKSSQKIVKQSSYNVGDKVKLVSKRPPTWNFDGLMDKYLGRIVQITKVMGDVFKFDGSDGWIFNINTAIDGKVIENDFPKMKKPYPFDWDGFKSGKFAVHCDTKEKAEDFMIECQMNGIVWANKEQLNQNSQWDCYEERTHYQCNAGGRLVFGIAAYMQLPILPYVKNFKEVNRKASVGEWVKVVNANWVPLTNGKPDYKNGDILLVLPPVSFEDMHNHARYADNDEGTMSKVLTDNEYVVIELNRTNTKLTETTTPSISNFSNQELLEELGKRLNNEK